MILIHINEIHDPMFIPRCKDDLIIEYNVYHERIIKIINKIEWTINTYLIQEINNKINYSDFSNLSKPRYSAILTRPFTVLRL